MMAIWQRFKSISLLQGPSGDENLCRIYSLPEDELVLCLRVVLAEWIEKSISKVTPKTFMRGIQFQILKILRQPCTESNDPNILLHSTKLCKYMHMLSRYKTCQEVDALYSKFVQCLYQEYKIVWLRGMHEDLEVDIRRLMEAQEVNPSACIIESEIDSWRNVISNQNMNLQRLETEIIQMSRNLNSSIVTFYEWNDHYRNAIIQSVENFLIVLTPELLEKGGCILTNKRNLEEKFSQLFITVSSQLENIQSYLTRFEKLHVFSRRAEKFESARIEVIGTAVETTLQHLQTISSSVAEWCAYDFEPILAINHEVIISACAQRERAGLLVRDSYRNNFGALCEQLRMHQLSLYRTFTLIVDCQPPMVIMKDSRRLISLKIFNLNNVFSTDFKVTVQLVKEDTVRDIRTKNAIPRNIPSAGNIVIANQDSFTNTNWPTGRGRQSRVGTQPRRRRSGSETSEVGRPVVTLDGRWTPDKKYIHVEKELIIKTINRNTSQLQRPTQGRRQRTMTQNQNDDSDKVTSEKVALLFIMELPFDNKQVWAISLPMIIAAHGSQNEKAWITMAWDDALATPKRPGFDVERTANWSQITQLLKGTFEVLVGEPLKPLHLQYLRSKAEQYFGNPFPQHISKTELSEDRRGRLSFWSWFFKSSLIVKEGPGGHFNEAWKNSYIEGFISFEGARDLLLNSSVEPGTFIVRFSDTRPGSLTLAFMAFDRQVYKMEPVEVYKSKSIADCATALLVLLNIRENTQRKEVFLRVFPDICKKEAFKKFYKKEGRKDDGYVPVLNTIPVLPMQQRNNNDNGSGNISLRNVEGSDTSASSALMQFDTNISGTSTTAADIPDQAQLNPSDLEGMDTDVEDEVDVVELVARIFSYDAFE